MRSLHFIGTMHVHGVYSRVNLLIVVLELRLTILLITVLANTNFIAIDNICIKNKKTHWKSFILYSKFIYREHP